MPARPAGHRPAPLSPQAGSGAPSPRRDAGAAADGAALSPRARQHLAIAAAIDDGTYAGGALHGGSGGGASERGDGSVQGMLSSILGVQLVFPPSGVAVPEGANATDLTAEQLQQAHLSRLLLLLGSFVILCLLLI